MTRLAAFATLVALDHEAGTVLAAERAAAALHEGRGQLSSPRGRPGGYAAVDRVLVALTEDRRRRPAARRHRPSASTSHGGACPGGELLVAADPLNVWYVPCGMDEVLGTEDPRQLRPPLEQGGALKRRGRVERRAMRTVGLFAGIGGIERALAAEGHEPLLLCELDHIARAVLDHRFPGIPKHDDVCSLRDLPHDTQLLAGGFPCQDLSQAGGTRGIDGRRSGLVREALRLAAKRRVPWLLLENVPFMLKLGRGRALEVIVTALEDLGYRWAYRVVDARAFGLPQRRERVFLVASLEDDPTSVLLADDAGAPTLPRDVRPGAAHGFYWTEGIRGLGWAVDAVPTLKGGSTVGVPSPPGVWMPDGRLVTPSIEDAERLQGFPAGWTKRAETVAKRGMRWKLVGNAVSVPVLRWIARRLARPGTAILKDVRPIGETHAWPRAAFNVGSGRYAIACSAWPKHTPPTPLHEFLRGELSPLSRRATAGFFARTQRSNLRFPPGFLETVKDHLRHMEAREA